MLFQHLHGLESLRAERTGIVLGVRVNAHMALQVLQRRKALPAFSTLILFQLQVELLVMVCKLMGIREFPAAQLASRRRKSVGFLHVLRFQPGKEFLATQGAWVSLPSLFEVHVPVVLGEVCPFLEHVLAHAASVLLGAAVFGYGAEICDAVITIL